MAMFSPHLENKELRLRAGSQMRKQEPWTHCSVLQVLCHVYHLLIVYKGGNKLWENQT